MGARGLAAGAVLVAGGLVVGGIVGYRLLDDGKDDGDPVVEEREQRNSGEGEVADSAPSPFAVSDTNNPEATAPVTDSATTADLPADASPAGVSSTSPTIDVPLADMPIDRIGREAMSDEFQVSLSVVLRGDRAMLLALIDSLRADGDAERILRLSIVLGELGDPAIDELIEELAYSADPDLVVASLDLMKRSGVDDVRARAVVSTLLANDSPADVLVPALSAIARPGSATDGERQDMANQIALLTRHESANVRSVSIDLLSRWTSDGSDTPVLLGALQDEDASVRRSAAYSLVGHQHNAEEVVAGLLRTAEDADENEAVRKAAILAVQRSPGADVSQRQRVDEILLLLNRRPAR